jgi:iron complex transport system ATP-binding protein
VLRVEDLVIRRGRVRILDGVSWTLRKGEHWVILGANGSGKTSLLSSLTGYLTPTSGSLVLLGEEFGRSDWRALRSRVGLVSSSVRQMMPDHEPALITVASGRYAMIDFWGSPKASERREARRILEQVECPDLWDRPWLYLSQGERQRVLIGRALMAKPELLILDEPCAGLDPAARERFLHFLNRLGRKPGGPSLVLVTHHVEEITPAFTHTLVLKQGRVLRSGRKATVVTSPTLTQAFGIRATVSRSRGRYGLAVRPDRQHIL